MSAKCCEDDAGCARRSRWPAAAAWGMVLIAFLLRSYGLSHDFDLGKIYHPDTAKQIAAAERFTRGVFYAEIGHRDYDGYPLFNSVMAAGVYHVARSVADAVNAQLGLHAERPVSDDKVLLEWIMRSMNVLFSSLSVWVMFLLARRMAGPGTALLAAAFLCVSPLDVATCHYASGDSATAFFALVSLFFSVRILQRGGALDYVLAAAACVCSFSAKYHGALTAFSLIAAHILRTASLKDLFGRASFRRAGLVLVTVVAVFFLTNPAALAEPSKGVRQILEFLSSSGASKAQATGFVARVTRWLFSVKMNLPVFAEFMSPVLLVCSLAGIVSSFFTDRARRVIAVLPVVYALVGLSSKTAGSAVYSTLVTPAMFLLGVLFLSDLMRVRVLRPLPKVVALAALLVSGAMLANGTYREMFFFGHRDTRALAENWLRENIPASFRIDGGAYSYLAEDLKAGEGTRAGKAYVKSSRRDDAAAGYLLLNAFWLEDNPLALFRNWFTEVYVQSPLIREGWELPVYQKIPSRFDTELILAEGRDFFRSPRVFRVKNERSVEKTIVSKNAMEDIALRVQCGTVPARVKVEVGGQTRSWWMDPEQVQCAVIKNLRPRLPHLKDLKAYRLRVESLGGPVQVSLAFEAEEKGMMLFNAGAYEEASVFLGHCVGEGKNPTVAAMAEICLALENPGQQGGRRDSVALPAGGKIEAKDILRLYHVDASFLEGLPYLEWDFEPPKCKGFRVARAGYGGRDRNELWPVKTTNHLRTVQTHLAVLDQGGYSASVPYRLGRRAKSGMTVTARILDASGCQVLPAQSMPLLPDSSGMFRTLDVSFAKPAKPGAVRLVLEMNPEDEVFFRPITVKPDVTAGVRNLARAMDALARGGDPRKAASPANFDLLMAMGRKLARDGHSVRGGDFFLAAAEACPGRAAPAEALAGVFTGSVPKSAEAFVSRYRDTSDERRMRPVGARFARGVELSGFILAAQTVRAGEPVLLKLRWDVSRIRSEYEPLAVWIHFLDTEGRTVFQGDHGLVESMIMGSASENFGPEGYYRIPVPAGVAPGDYRMQVGLWVPQSRQRLRLLGAPGSLPIDKWSVEIVNVTVQ